MTAFYYGHVGIAYIVLLVIGVVLGILVKRIIQKTILEENKQLTAKPIVEILNALIYCAVFWKLGFSAYTLCTMLMGSLLLIIAFIDFKTMLIPNWSVFAVLILGIAVIFLNHDISWLERIIGFLTGGLILLIIYIVSGGGIGMGDVKLMAAAGLYMGWKLTLCSLLMGSVIGGIAGVIILISGRGKLKTAIPFGPFLVLGILISILYGDILIDWYWYLFTI